MTLTFLGDVKTFTAYHRCNAWLRSVESAAGQPIAWFRADEYGEKFGKFHLHLLITNVAHLHRFTWMNRWASRNGFARILPFDSSKGAAYYCAKYVRKQFGEWELSDNIDAFQIQQPALPLIGQRGTNNMRRTAPTQQFVPSKSHSATKQLSLRDFIEPDLSDVDTDEIRTLFYEQTMRKRKGK